MSTDATAIEADLPAEPLSPEEAGPEYSSNDPHGLHQAAAEITQRRAARPRMASLEEGDAPEQPTIEIKYHPHDPASAPPSVTLHQAAKDLGQWRAEVEASERAAVEAALQQAQPQQAAATREQQLDQLRQYAEQLEQRADELRPEGTPTLAEQRASEEAQRQQYVVQGYQQALQAGQLQTSANLQAIMQVHAQEFPHVRTADDVAKLEPAKYARWQALDNAYRQEEARAQQAGHALAQITQHQQQQHQQATAAWIAQQNAIIDAKFPTETRDPAFKRAAWDTVKSWGFSDDEIRGDPRWQDARVQTAVLEATRNRLAAQRVRDHRRPVPPVHRSSAAGLREAAEGSAIDRLNARLNQSGKLTDAVDLLISRRSARR